uniref:Putative MOS-2 like protein n=1 Tax=Raphanus sativus TaxID=3726 RepID=D0R6K2_RAPSA|nr:putative MOS-2 like protein [Raphanus sativus]
MNVMRRLKSIASGRTSISSDPGGDYGLKRAKLDQDNDNLCTGGDDPMQVDQTSSSSSTSLEMRNTDMVSQESVAGTSNVAVPAAATVDDHQRCEVADLGSQEEERCLKKLKDKEKAKKASNGSRETERVSRNEVRASEKHDRGGERRVKKPSWLRSHIKVRIVSKQLKGGRLYLKKGKVVDVVGPTTCDITMDETQELVQGVDQELLETALPRRGGPVLILSGKHKGVYGNLVEKDLDRETGVLRDLDNHKMLDVRLEQVAEYMGDMDDVEY